jgi:hypothetical protein
MKIAQQYQVFDDPVDLDSKDFDRLKNHLTGWNKLNEILLLGINEPDLRRLVIMELLGSQRMVIVNRLLGRLATLQRERIHNRISKLML